MKRRPLPAFGPEFCTSPVPRHPFVVMGPGSLQYAVKWLPEKPLMALLDGSDPFDFSWPVADRSVMLIEINSFDTPRLERFVAALFRDGALTVTAIRTAHPGHKLPTVSPVYRKEAADARQTA